MSAIIDDDLVAKVAAAIIGAHHHEIMGDAEAARMARAALAVAVPAIGERCAKEADDYTEIGSDGSDKFVRGARQSAVKIAADIRSLTKEGSK